MEQDQQTLSRRSLASLFHTSIIIDDNRGTLGHSGCACYNFSLKVQEQSLLIVLQSDDDAALCDRCWTRPGKTGCTGCGRLCLTAIASDCTRVASRMSEQTDVRLLTLAGVAHRCARETRLFFQNQRSDPRYCFELFRRAIAERDERAWELVYAQYCPLVGGWVKRHSALPDSGEESQYFVNRAFEKMWGALTPEKFGHFVNLRSLLRYLQMCVHSVILDQVRLAERSVVDVQPEALAAGRTTGAPIVEDLALERLHRQEFWRAIDGRLCDEQERRVVYGSFVLALKPRDLYAQFGDTFRDVREVYRVKERVLARLRRDAELEEIFRDYA